MTPAPITMSLPPIENLGASLRVIAASGMPVVSFCATPEYARALASRLDRVPGLEARVASLVEDLGDATAIQADLAGKLRAAVADQIDQRNLCVGWILVSIGQLAVIVALAVSNLIRVWS